MPTGSLQNRRDAETAEENRKRVGKERSVSAFFTEKVSDGENNIHLRRANYNRREEISARL